MNAPLYNIEILRLAAAVPAYERLDAPMASVEKRSAVCGSRVIVDVTMADGRIGRLGLDVKACALGQASAAIMAAHAVGQSAEQLSAARDALAAWLGGEGPVPAWPGLEIFTTALPHRGRHAAIRLPFEAVAEAATKAQG